MVQPRRLSALEVVRGHFHLKCFLLTIVIYLCLVVIAWCRVNSYTTPPTPPTPPPLSSPSLSSSSSSSSSSPPSPPSPPSSGSISSDVQTEATTAHETVTTTRSSSDHDRHHHRRRHHRRTSRRRHRSGRSLGTSKLCEESNICLPVSFLVMLYLVYLVESWHCGLRFELRNATTTHDVYRCLDDASSCRRPRIAWHASGYHYARKSDRGRGTGCHFYFERIDTYKRSASFDRDSFLLLLPSSFRDRCDSCCTRIDNFDCSRYRYRSDDDDDDDDDVDGDRGSLDTRESFVCSDEDGNRADFETSNREVEESKERIIDQSDVVGGLEGFAATRISVSKSFEFHSCSVRQDYERQKRNFHDLCRHLDDFMEFEEHLQLPGCDLAGNYFAVRGEGGSNHPRLRRCPRWTAISSLMFWMFTFFFLSWPYRLLVELNTATVALKIRKVFASGCGCCCHGCRARLKGFARDVPTNRQESDDKATTKTCANSPLGRSNVFCCHGDKFGRFGGASDGRRRRKWIVGGGGGGGDLDRAGNCTEFCAHPGHEMTLGSLRFQPPPPTACKWQSDESKKKKKKKKKRLEAGKPTDGFYRRPPHFDKKSTVASPFHPRVIVKYRENYGCFRSEIGAQKNHFRADGRAEKKSSSSSSSSSPLRKSKLIEIVRTFSDVKNKLSTK